MSIQRRQTIAKNAATRFRIDQYEAIVREYQLCVRANRCPALVHRPGRQVLEDEVVALNLGQAQAFCAWRGGQLPSNRAWEAAAQGPGGSAYPWGDQFVSSRLTEPTLIREYDTGYTLFRRSNSVDSGSPFGVHDTAGTWGSSRSTMASPMSAELRRVPFRRTRPSFQARASGE